MSDDYKELKRHLSKPPGKPSIKQRIKAIRNKMRKTSTGRYSSSKGSITAMDDMDEEDEAGFDGTECQWATPDNTLFVPASTTVEHLPPGCYEISFLPSGQVVFSSIPIKIEDLIRFPDTNSDRVIAEIKTFWSKKDHFKKHGIPFKRGMLLWGPPGSGKSCTVQFVCKDIIEKGGICVKFTDPRTFSVGMRKLRKIENSRPVVAIMEDLDAILEVFNESDVLNLLDGIDLVEDVVFLATTNYPEKLGKRVVNRPSRFDKRFKIPYLSPESRRIYFEHLFKTVSEEDRKAAKVDLDQWVTDSDQFSIAHMKELFTAVYILGDEYKSAVETLKDMFTNISSDQDSTDGGFGFQND